MADIRSLDRLASGLISPQAIPGLSSFFHLVTQLGNGAIWSIAFALYLALGKKKLIAALFLMTLLFSSVVNEDIKDIVRRERPQGADIDPLFLTGLNYSFPSQHSQTALLLATLFVAYLGLRYSPIIYSVALLVCISRIYLGFHYFTDVIGGIAIGILIGELAVLGMYTNGIPLKGGFGLYLARRLGWKPPEQLTNIRQQAKVFIFPLTGLCVSAAAMMLGLYYLSLLVVAFTYLSSVILPGKFEPVMEH